VIDLETPEHHERGGNPEAEVAWQAGRANAIEIAATPRHTFERYASCRNWRVFHKEGLFRQLRDVAGKSVLDFGCGEGELSTQIAWLGANVTGVDLSPELVEVARRRVELDGLTDRVELLSGDILEMDGMERRFDVVVCCAVLHHVPLESVFPRLLKLVKDGGTILIKEPIAFSPGLQRMRDAVPVEKDVSPEERQLTRDEIDYLASKMSDVRTWYYHLSMRLVRVLRLKNQLDGRPFTKTIMMGLGTLDRILTAIPLFRRFAGIIVMAGTVRHD